MHLVRGVLKIVAVFLDLQRTLNDAWIMKAAAPMARPMGPADEATVANSDPAAAAAATVVPAADAETAAAMETPVSATLAARDTVVITVLETRDLYSMLPVSPLLFQKSFHSSPMEVRLIGASNRSSPPALTALPTVPSALPASLKPVLMPLLTTVGSATPPASSVTVRAFWVVFRLFQSVMTERTEFSVVSVVKLMLAPFSAFCARDGLKLRRRDCPSFWVSRSVS